MKNRLFLFLRCYPYQMIIFRQKTPPSLRDFFTAHNVFSTGMSFRAGLAGSEECLFRTSPEAMHFALAGLHAHPDRVGCACRTGTCGSRDVARHVSTAAKAVILQGSAGTGYR
ncbi:MAG: hypothetical protein LBR08_00430 [Bacteroidales bacterium]|jgi:hypothetical protein|nr:hypothetical protein [Bacteroidales bacterium]